MGLVFSFESAMGGFIIGALVIVIFTFKKIARLEEGIIEYVNSYNFLQCKIKHYNEVFELIGIKLRNNDLEENRKGE